jgi:hypothetical protein
MTPCFDSSAPLVDTGFALSLGVTLVGEGFGCEEAISGVGLGLSGGGGKVTSGDGWLTMRFTGGLELDRWSFLFARW